MVQSAIAAADREPIAPAVPATVTEVCDDLLKLFGSVPDGRSGQGRDHPVAAVFALATAAVVAGMKGYTAIARWVKDVPPRCWRTCISEPAPARRHRYRRRRSGGWALTVLLARLAQLNSILVDALADSTPEGNQNATRWPVATDHLGNPGQETRPRGL